MVSAVVPAAGGFAVTPWGRYRDVEARTGFSRAHIEKAAYSGCLKSDGKGKRRRFHVNDVDEWMRRGAVAAVPVEGKVAA